MPGVAVMHVDVTKVARPAARSAGIPARHHVVRSLGVTTFVTIAVIPIIAIASVIVAPFMSLAFAVPLIAIVSVFRPVTTLGHYWRRLERAVVSILAPVTMFADYRRCLERAGAALFAILTPLHPRARGS